MRTFPLKIHYKAIKILAVRWVGTRLLMQIFHRDFYKRRKLGSLLGMTTKSVCSILQLSKYFTGRLGRSESLYFWKRQSKGAHFEKICNRATHIFPAARCSMASTLQICFLRLWAIRAMVWHKVFECGNATVCCGTHKRFCLFQSFGSYRKISNNLYKISILAVRIDILIYGGCTNKTEENRVEVEHVKRPIDNCVQVFISPLVAAIVHSNYISK